MWRNLFLEQQPEHNLLMPTLEEPESPTDSDIIMFKQKTQTEGPPFVDFEDMHDQAEMQLENLSKPTGNSVAQTLGLRIEWTKQEEACFFKYLAKHMLNNEEQFVDWARPNKKGIFKQMHYTLKTKDNVQCRLKFSSYKRKHSDRRNKLHFQPCMGSLILKKLKILSVTDTESKEIMELLVERQTRIQQLKCATRQQIKEAKKEQKYLQEIVKRLRSYREQANNLHVNYTPEVIKIEPNIQYNQINPQLGIRQNFPYYQQQLKKLPQTNKN